MRPRIGLLDLRDLFEHPWQHHEMPGHLAALGLEPVARAAGFRAFTPPPCVVVVVDGVSSGYLAPFADWLAQASRLVVVRQWAQTDETLADPDLVGLVDEEWGMLDGLANAVINDRRGADPEPLRRALDQARAFAETVPDWGADVAVERPMAALRSGSWLSLETGRWESLPSASEIAHDGRTAYLFDSDSGARTFLPLDGSVPLLRRTGELAMPTPDRTAYLRFRNHEKEHELRAVDDGRVLQMVSGFGYDPLGFDPRWPIGWTGQRLMFFWQFARDGRMGMIAPAAHDWPCGHAKKLFGNEDNDPRWVHLASRADAYLSVFDHDVIVASAVPMYWEDRGGAAVAVWPPPDPLRALIFTSDEEQRMVWDANPGEENSRGDVPAVVLGESDEVRYAVSLEKETYRMRGKEVEQLSPGGGGFAVYDAGHRVVRMAAGRLLGGWGGIATVEHEGQLFREDLSSGARRPLGPSDRPFTHVLPIAGTENVLLVQEAPLLPIDSPAQTRTTHLRLV